MKKALNLYAGIGGNRKLWPEGLEVTAVERDENVAAVYQDLYPGDRVVIGDAHEYLLRHSKEFDYIWSSPPCPSHSQTNSFLHAQGIIRYPDLKLYEEIIFLKHFFKGKYTVENVVSYYDPLIPPQKRGRHYFWANFHIPWNLKSKKIGRMDKLKNGERGDRKENLDALGFDLSKYRGIDKAKCLRNCVTPEIGLAIFKAAEAAVLAGQVEQSKLFS